MGYLIKMPNLEMGMQQGMLLEWFVDLNESVIEEQPIAEIESEKTVAEIEAREDGVLRRVLVDEGETAEPGTVLGIVAGEDESIDSLEQEAGVVDAADDDTEEAADAADEDEVKGEKEETAQSGTIKASPKARKLASESGLELASIKGSGPDGAVTVSDVEAVDEQEPEPATTSASDEEVEATSKARERADELGVDLGTVKGTGPRGTITVDDIEGGTESGTASGVRERRELSGMRQAIADRLGQSYREAVHVTLSRTVDVEEPVGATDIADQYLDVDVSLTDLLLIAVSSTLAEHPEFNATFEDEIHELRYEQNIGIAVDIDRGLVTPVIKDVESKSLAELVSERRRLTQRVLDDEHSMDDLSDGTFTITNLGVLGIDSFTPIINPPQIAILAINRIREQPVRDGNGDGVAFRRHIGFDLTFDHRVVDGADAARFLESLAENVRDPWPLLLDRT